MSAHPIEVHALRKLYGKDEVLRGVDFTVGAGEVVGFLGRNGAGKSTTIRILMGITRPTSGEVRMFGEALARDRVRWRQRIGYVAQEQAFYGWMTPLSIGRFVRGFFPSWDDVEYTRLIGAMDLPPKQRIHTFSGGMKVKLALSLALAHRPPLLVLDEPTAGLDPVARREFLEIVREEGARQGRTTFFSSHLVDEIELVSDRVAILDAGRTRYEGTIEGLLGRVKRLEVEDSSDGQPHFEERFTRSNIGVLHRQERGGRRQWILEFQTEHAAEEFALEFPLDSLSLEEVFIAMVRNRASRA